MVDDAHPISIDIGIALEGLDEAAARLRERADGVLRGAVGNIAVSLTESLLWISVLDNGAQKTISDYFEKRNRDAPVVGGLIYARNFHVHELISTSEMAITIGRMRVVKVAPGEQGPRPGRGTLFSIELRWLDFDELPPPEKPERRQRDMMYRDCVALRALTHPVEEARSWLHDLLGRSSE